MARRGLASAYSEDIPTCRSSGCSGRYGCSVVMRDYKCKVFCDLYEIDYILCNKVLSENYEILKMISA